MPGKQIPLLDNVVSISTVTIVILENLLANDLIPNLQKINFVIHHHMQKN